MNFESFERHLKFHIWFVYCKISSTYRFLHTRWFSPKFLNIRCNYNMVFKYKFYLKGIKFFQTLPLPIGPTFRYIWNIFQYMEPHGFVSHFSAKTYTYRVHISYRQLGWSTKRPKHLPVCVNFILLKIVSYNWILKLTQLENKLTRTTTNNVKMHKKQIIWLVFVM